MNLAMPGLPLADMPPASARLGAAEAATAAKDWRRAAALWEALRADSPGEARHWLKAGEACYEAGLFDRADQILGEAVVRFPDDRWIGYHHIIAAHRRREWDETLRRAETLRASFPEFWPAWVESADALAALGHSEEADRRLRDAAARFPNVFWPAYGIARLAAAATDGAGAVRIWSKLVERFPTQPAAAQALEAAKQRPLHRSPDRSPAAAAPPTAAGLTDRLWEKLHLNSGATGRGRNGSFVSLFLNICQELNPNASFEVGAYEAEFSRELKRRLPNIQSYAFEANPYVHNQFKTTFSSDVSYLNQAIGADNSPKEFHIPKVIPGQEGQFQPARSNKISSLRARANTGVEYETVICECTTLDAWHEDLGWPDSVLWVDAEGAAGDVIRGAEQALHRSVQCVFIELEKTRAWLDQWLAADVVEAMEGLGFFALARDAETSWQYNQIFIKPEALTEKIFTLVEQYIKELLKEQHIDSLTMKEIETFAAQMRAAQVSGNAEVPSPAAGARELRSQGDAAKLVDALLRRGLLLASEAEHFARNLTLPDEFENRVLDRHAPAEPVEEAPGIKSEVIIPAEPVPTVPLPVLTYDGPCPAELSNPPSRNLPAVLHEARVGKVYVGVARTTLILSEDEYFAGISSADSRWIAPALYAAGGDLELQGTAAILFANGASLYSHWMFDLLPKLEVLQRAGWSPERVDHYVVNAYRDSFQKETLRHLGIPDEKVIAGGGLAIRADRLLIPSETRAAFCTPHWARDFIRRTFGPSGTPAGTPGDCARLYISRAEARRRRVLNEETVREVLGRRGFRTIVAERHSVRELAALVGAAEQIVAPHGAGLTNVVFASPGIRALEFYGAHIVSEAWLMTGLAGGQHYLLAGKDERGRYPWHPGAYEKLSWLERNLMDYYVDPGDLERALDRMSGP